MKCPCSGKWFLAALLAGALTIHQANAGAVAYTSSAAFDAAAGPLTLENFNDAVMSSPTVVSYAAGAFSCAGPDYCPGFFGINSTFTDGSAQSLYFASPDTVTFTFTSAINEFSIVIGGAGNVDGPITMTALLSNGDSALALDDYSNSSGTFVNNSVFFGLTDATGFTSVTFSPNNSGDGIYFDELNYGSVQVPEPASFAVFGIGVVALGLIRRRLVG